MRSVLSWVGSGFAGFLVVLTGCAGSLDLAGSALEDPAATLVAADIELANAEDRYADVAPAGRSMSPCVEVDEPSGPIRQAMLEALNQYRQENGLPTLIYSRRLEAAADGHVRDLWERGFFAHINPEGKDPGARAVAAGFCHQYVGENLAAGQNTVENAMRAWKNSPGHNQNMLEPLYIYVGLGHSIDPSGRHYWGQEFAYELP